MATLQPAQTFTWAHAVTVSTGQGHVEEEEPCNRCTADAPADAWLRQAPLNMDERAALEAEELALKRRRLKLEAAKLEEEERQVASRSTHTRTH